MITTDTDGPASGLRAVILAGGKGTRLLPYTASFPKPLVPLGDTPVIEILIRQLMLHGICDIVLTLGHLAELVKAYFYHRKALTEQIRLTYVEESEPTGTAGSLAFVADLTDTFLVMNGDLLTDLNFHGLVQFHREQGSALTIATQHRRVKVDYGVLEFNTDSRITGYIEKPEHGYHTSMGIYVYEPRVLSHIAQGEYLDFPDLVLRMLGKGERVMAYPADCLWMDIGRPEEYGKAQELYARKERDADVGG